MTRRMADSVDAANLPDGFDLYGAYVDGLYKNYVQACARFGIAKVVGIAVASSTDMGIVGDCENGDMTPQTAVSWVQMRRAKVDPTIYCSEAAWPAVQQAFNDAKVPQPHYWIAGYPGSVGDALYPGSIAHQWIDRGPYDESIVADYWPGVDSAPTPQPTGEPMAVSNIVSFKPGQLDAFQVSLGALWHKWAIGGVWKNESIGPAGVTFAGQPQASVVGGACWVTAEDSNGHAWAFVQTTTSGSWANQELP